MTVMEKQTIKALADCDLKIYQTAKRLNCSVGTLKRRIQAVYNRTGLDATKFYDLVKLLVGIKGEEI